MHRNVLLGVVVIVSLAVVGGIGTATAADVGASGSCDNGSSGGQGGIGADDDGNVDGTNPDEVDSATSGIRYYAENDLRCEPNDSDENGADDYTEVHVTGSPGTVQVCYDEHSQYDPTEAIVVNRWGHNRCPTDENAAEQ